MGKGWDGDVGGRGLRELRRLAEGGEPSMEFEKLAAATEAMQLDEATLATLNPCTQDDALAASPPRKRTLLQPTSSERAHTARAQPAAPP